MLPLDTVWLVERDGKQVTTFLQQSYSTQAVCTAMQIMQSLLSTSGCSFVQCVTALAQRVHKRGWG